MPPPCHKESISSPEETGYQTAQTVSMRKPQSKSPPQRKPLLTPREKQVLEMLLRGLSDKLIASELSFSPGAARRHVDSLLRKFKVNSRLQLALVFLRSVVISPR